MLRNASVSKSAFRGLCQASAKLALYPGVLPTLTNLVERGVLLGAVTNLPGWMVEPMLECHELDELLGSVVTLWPGRAQQTVARPAPLLLPGA